LPDGWTSPTERRIAEAWQNTLAHADFDRDSNFFEVGGSSLKTFSVISRLRTDMSLGRERLPDDAIYRFPTIRQLAACIEGAYGRGGAGMAATGTILVTLKPGHDALAEPLFVIASAGGTLGAYEKLVHALDTTREVIGVRDPYLWGKRDPTTGFGNWVALYLTAIRARQPEGPYHLLGYSSAGAFAYEIARQLRHAGARVALLALVDPLAMDRADKKRFGYWALQARFESTAFVQLVKVAGWLRRGLPRRRAASDQSANRLALTARQFDAFRQQALTDRQHILQLSALLELNSGLPVALTPHEMDALSPSRYLDALVAKLRAKVPGVDADTIERLVVQYQLQVRTQHHYRLGPLGGTLALFDPAGPHHGLLAAQFRPWVERLSVFHAPLATPEGRLRELAAYFPAPLRSHYLSMRDDGFARGVARQLDRLLDHRDPR
jgi:thioesterase domain-containing protein